MILGRAVVALGVALLTPSRADSLPLGDGKVTRAPTIGHVFACPTRFEGGGAFRDGPWIRGTVWDPAAKPVVGGAVAWPGAQLTITLEGERRVVRANSLPSHPTGVFPIRPDEPAYQYDRNPNAIREQHVLLTLPATPAAAPAPGCLPMGMIAIALSGAPIFSALDAQGRDAPAHEIQDRCNGHPERSSQYHYHNWSPCLRAASANAPVGWMLDGYPILGPRDEQGREITNADLDECHGRTGPVMIDGQVVTTYHYRFTLEFPYTIGCFRGTPVMLPRRGPPPGPPPGF